MEVLFWLALVFGVFFLPLILAICAMVKVGNLREEVRALRLRLDAAPGSSPDTPAPVATRVPRKVPAPPPATVPPPPQPAAAKAPVVPPPLPRARVDREVLLGGRIASFIGIGLLLIGIALLIGYAVRHAWLGPAARIALGVLAGALLVGLGHASEVKGQGRLTVLARVLTGGGTAVFYFSVYAAFGIYGLIGPAVTAAGLVIAVAATLGLALVYNSQTVAVIGVIGALLMPPLISEDAERVWFLLSYIATVNVPVIALGIRRRWQGLYNTAFAFTMIYQGLLLIDLRVADAPWLGGFAVVYFLQFTALGLLKLRAERALFSRQADIVRLVLNSLCLLAMTYVVLDTWGQASWMGAALLGLAGLHLIAARLGARWFPAFTFDLQALLLGALLFASLALPAQLAGAWISVGWALMGAAVCVLALRVRMPLLQGGALVLGVIGVLKSIGYDWQGYESPPTLFLNARFLSGLCTAALLGAQGLLHQRAARDQTPPADATAKAASCYVGSTRTAPARRWPLPLWLYLGTVAAAILLVTTELHRWPIAWASALITLWWALSASALTVWGLTRRQPVFRYTGWVVFGVTTVKVLFIDLAELDGLARIAAFMGVGLLLLLLSYLYQHMAARLTTDTEETA